MPTLNEKLTMILAANAAFWADHKAKPAREAGRLAHFGTILLTL
ncbi:MAG: hypothetical protein ACJA0K_000403 [Maricaulis maris]|jgi:hypothetical protein